MNQMLRSQPNWSHSAKRCHLDWDIYNPFLTWQKLEAKFYQEYPTLIPWKVSLEPVDRAADYWEFSFVLEYDQDFERRGEIVAEHVSVDVLLGVDLITRRDEQNFLFCNANRFKYHVKGKVDMPLQTEPHQLVIRVEVALPRFRCGEHSFGRNSRDEDFKCLSKNMKDLLKNELYTDMIMNSANLERRYNVHSYVLEARWNKFFAKHPRPCLPRKDLKVNISNGLLLDILAYMYSGELSKNWPEWKESRYASELYAVIFRYDLHHLYKAIVKSDMKQKRVTRNSSNVECRRFPLEIVKGRPVKKALFCWSVNIYSSYRINFRIRVGGEYGNWLSYTLESRSKFRVGVKMNFTIVKSIGEGTPEKIVHVHGATYDINPHETKVSEPQIFLGCPETFGDSNETGIKYYIRCFLNVFDGTKLDLVHCLGEETLQDDSERFRLLSRHMSYLYKQRNYTDMLIYSAPENTGDTRGFIKENVHRGLLVARVPEWWKGLKNVVEEPNTMQLPYLPREATCTLRGHSMGFFLDYLYSGRVVKYISLSDLDEIQRFAELTRFGSLNDFVIRIATNQINQ